MESVREGVFSALHSRLEQRRHWQLGASVRDGKQPTVDPDSHRLIELRTDERVYRGDAGQFVKRLVDGSWRVESHLPDVIS
jgi:hypothetical protein